MKRALFPEITSVTSSVGFLILRIIAGGAMMQHGWGKIQSPLSWMGPDAPVPGFLQGLAALSEFGGGLALILGLLTPLAMLGWVCTMGFAVWTHFSKGDPWVSKGGGGSYESALLYLGVAVLFLLAGPGRYSLDNFILKGRGPKGQVRAGDL